MTLIVFVIILQNPASCKEKKGAYVRTSFELLGNRSEFCNPDFFAVISGWDAVFPGTVYLPCIPLELRCS